MTIVLIHGSDQATLPDGTDVTIMAVKRRLPTGEVLARLLITPAGGEASVRWVAAGAVIVLPDGGLRVASITPADRGGPAVELEPITAD